MRIKMNYPIGASSGVLNPTRNKKMRLIRGLYGYETVKNDKKYRKKDKPTDVLSFERVPQERIVRRN